jgi:hypothetical protein
MRDMSRVQKKTIIAAILLIGFIFMGAGEASALFNAPVQIKPANNSIVSGSIIEFDWSQVSGADTYYLYLVDDDGYKYSDGWIGNYIGVDLSPLPDNGQWYYWKVAAGNTSTGEGGYFSPLYGVRNGPSAIPNVPALISPNNGDIVNGPTIPLEWAYAARAYDYYLQVAVESDFSADSLVINESAGRGTGGNLINMPDNGQQYFWRVMSHNLLGYSGYSDYRYFINGPSALPAVPTLIYPENNSTASGSDVPLDYYADRAYLYCIQVTFDPLSWQPEKCFEYYYDVTLTGLPDNGEKIYWKVRAWNNKGYSSPSSVFSFVNGPSSIPEAPILDLPGNNTNAAGTEVTFTWDDTARAYSYHFQLAYDLNFTDIAYEEEISADYIGIQLDIFPDNGQRFYWRVRAYNAKGYGPFSYVWSFINGPSAIPEIPVLKAPANNSMASGASVLLEWNQADRANNYYLQVALDPDFKIIKFGNWLGNKLGYNLPVSNVGLVYYWRVGAGNSLGESPFSDYWSFINGTLSECAAAVGTGNGWGHIDTCYTGGSYYLKDISRRSNFNPHGHNGSMAENASIITEDFATGGLMKDTDNIWDAAAQRSGVDAHVHTGLIYDYLYNGSYTNKQWTVDSYDDYGSTMKTIVNNSNCKNNAFWNDDLKRLCIGNMDNGVLPFSGALDMMGHEWGHGVFFNTATKHGNIDYYEERGAVMEAFSDWMGTTIEHYYGDNDWTMGEDISFTMRNLADPHSSPYYPSPDYYIDDSLWHNPIGCFNPICSHSDPNWNDCCWAHINAGVLNKMFYLLSNGGTHPKSQITVRAIGIHNAMELAFKANRNEWKSDVNFQSALKGMIDEAKYKYGDYSSVVYQVQNAGAAVGITTLPMINASASPSAGGTVTGGGYYEWGSTATVTATPDPAYLFVNWTEGTTEVSADESYSFTVDGGRTLSANFVLKPQKISINPTSNDFGLIYIGETSPPRTFTVTNIGSLPLTIGILSKGGTNIAQFKIIANYCSNVTLDANESCTAQVEIVPTKEGSLSAALIVPSDDPDTPVLSVPLSGVGAYILITATAGIGGTISPGTTKLTYGESQDFTIKPNIGYHIKDVKVDTYSQGAITNYSFTNVTDDHTIEALFESNSATFTVTATAGSGGTITPASAIVTWRQTRPFTVTPNTGYHIASITGCGGTSVGVQPYNTSYTYTTGPITANCTVTAAFAINTYTVTPSPDANGTMSPSTPQTVNYNQTTSFTVTPNTGYHIASVTGCGGASVGVQPYDTPYTYTTGTITADCTVQATFAINTYNLTVKKTGIGTGTVTSADGKINCGATCAATYNYNKIVTLTATPEANYSFAGWSGGCSGTGACNVRMTADKTVTAAFQCQGLPVRNAVTLIYFSSLQAAYNAANSGETIQIQAVLLTENPALNLNKTVTIIGGYNCDFTSVIGQTSIKGELSITNGEAFGRGIQLIK